MEEGGSDEEELRTEVREECGKYGRVMDVKVERGDIYVLYESNEGASKAVEVLD